MIKEGELVSRRVYTGFIRFLNPFFFRVFWGWEGGCTTFSAYVHMYATSMDPTHCGSIT